MENFKQKLKKFKKEIAGFYTKNRRDLPWRRTRDPYHILLSEMMLQQTQVSRVIPKYEEFLKKFSTMESLALAKNSDVLALWQGLGYNRRALFLKRTCEELYRRAQSKSSPKTSKSASIPRFPDTKEELEKLPGIGQSTSGAILAFAFNKPSIFIETNIRAVFLHFFFSENSDQKSNTNTDTSTTGTIHDKEIYKLVEQTIDQENPREWYYALYDYGTWLKLNLGKTKRSELHQKSRHFNKQSKFEGSNRQVRAAIVRIFLEESKRKGPALQKRSDLSPEKISLELQKKHNLSQATLENVQKNVAALEKEGFIKMTKKKGFYTLI